MMEILRTGYPSFDWVEQELRALFERVGGPFSEAPASSSMSKHHCYRGGLLYHSWEVFAISLSILKGLFTGGGSSLILGGAGSDLRRLTIAQYLLVSYIHDLHKAVDFFGERYYVPNILKNGQQSDRKPFEINENYLEVEGELSVSGEELPTLNCLQHLLHREKKSISGGSVSLAWVQGYAPRLMSLITPEMQQAILYHDGGYGRAKYELSGGEEPMTIVIHAADMLSSRHEMALVSVFPLNTLLARMGVGPEVV